MKDETTVLPVEQHKPGKPQFFKDLPVGERFEICGFTVYVKKSPSTAR
jgi:hypothetical protein